MPRGWASCTESKPTQSQHHHQYLDYFQKGYYIMDYILVLWKLDIKIQLSSGFDSDLRTLSLKRYWKKLVTTNCFSFRNLVSFWLKTCLWLKPTAAFIFTPCFENYIWHSSSLINLTEYSSALYRQLQACWILEDRLFGKTDMYKLKIKCWKHSNFDQICFVLSGNSIVIANP